MITVQRYVDFYRRNWAATTQWAALAGMTLYFAATGQLLPNAERNWLFLIAGAGAVFLACHMLAAKIDGHDGGLSALDLRMEAAGIWAGMMLLCHGSGLYSSFEFVVIGIGVSWSMLGMYYFIDTIKVHEKKEIDAGLFHKVPLPRFRLIVSYLVFAAGGGVMCLPMI